MACVTDTDRKYPNAPAYFVWLPIMFVVNLELTKLVATATPVSCCSSRCGGGATPLLVIGDQAESLLPAGEAKYVDVTEGRPFVRMKRRGPAKVERKISVKRKGATSAVENTAVTRNSYVGPKALTLVKKATDPCDRAGCWLALALLDSLVHVGINSLIRSGASL